MKSFYTLALTVAVLGIATACVADDTFVRGADSKINGSAYNAFSGWSAGTFQDHAYDHANMLQEYSNTGEQIPEEVVQDHVNAIRTNVDSAKRAYSKLSDAAKTDSTVADHLQSIEEHQKSAIEALNQLEKERQNNPSKLGEHSATVARELSAARDAHDQLQQQLDRSRFSKNQTSSDPSNSGSEESNANSDESNTDSDKSTENSLEAVSD